MEQPVHADSSARLILLIIFLVLLVGTLLYFAFMNQYKTSPSAALPAQKTQSFTNPFDEAGTTDNSPATASSYQNPFDASGGSEQYSNPFENLR